MRLKYQILWIENETDWVDSIEDQFQEYLNELGFSYERKLITKEEQGIDYNKYDLYTKIKELRILFHIRSFILCNNN